MIRTITLLISVASQENRRFLVERQLASPSWATHREPESKQTKQQAGVKMDLEALKKAQLVKNRKDWAGEFLDNYGYAPHSYCKQDSSSCPEGFGSSCYVTGDGCTPKWEVTGDEKCSGLPNPDHSKWLTSFLDPSTSALDSEISKGDEAYCNEYKCTKNKSHSAASFCRDVTDADRDAKKAAGNMFGGYNNISLNKLIRSGDAQAGEEVLESTEVLGKDGKDGWKGATTIEKYQ